LFVCHKCPLVDCKAKRNVSSLKVQLVMSHWVTLSIVELGARNRYC